MRHPQVSQAETLIENIRFSLVTEAGSRRVYKQRIRTICF
jgi:hypothetical protein